MSELAGRTALVTGAGQNVGADIARRLATLGAHVGVNDLFEDRATAVVDEIIAHGGSAAVVHADVTDVAAVAEAFGSFGPVDVLVNNAGIPTTGFTMQNFWQEDPSAWKPFIDLNVYGPMNCTHAVLGGMVERGWGRVITISSESARFGDRKLAAYAASKGAGPALMRSVAKEVGRHGVTCNSLSLATQERVGLTDDGELRLKSLAAYAMPRLGRGTDVAGCVAWLVSDDGAWVTGQNIPINGGYATS